MVSNSNTEGTFKCSYKNCMKTFGNRKDLMYHYDVHPSEVFEWLYLGGYFNATNRKELDEMKVKYIVNCAGECKDLFSEEISYLRLDMVDQNGFSIAGVLDSAVDYMKNAKEKGDGNVFVHCQLGKSRSPSVIIAYMIREMGYSTEEAYKFLKKKRQLIMPNLGFMMQLKEYETKCKDNK